MNINNDTLPCQYTLPNGITIVHIPSIYKGIFRIECILRTGMLYEQKKEKGLAHFLEHLMSFFPSKKYPNSKTNQKYLQSKAIDVNAYTEELVTGYYLEGNTTFFDKVLDILMNNLIDPVYDQEIIEQEIKAVETELYNITQDTYFNFEKMIDKVLFKNTSLSIGADEELNNIKNIHKSKNINLIKNFHKKEYCPPKTIILFVLHYTNDEFYQLVQDIYEKYFNVNEKTKPNTIPQIPCKPKIEQQKCCNIYFTSRKSDGGKISIAFPVPFNKFSKESYILSFLNYVLNSGMGSLLMHKARIEEGLVYNFSNKIDYFPCELQNLNVYMITTSFQNEEILPKLFKIILNTIQNLIDFYTLQNNENNNAKEYDIIKTKENEYKHYLKVVQSKQENDMSFHRLLNFFHFNLIWNRKLQTISQYLKEQNQSICDLNLIRQTLKKVFNFNKLKVFYSCGSPVLQNYNKKNTKHHVF